MNKNKEKLPKDLEELREYLTELVDEYFPKIKPNGGNKGRGESMVIIARALVGVKNILDINYKDICKQCRGKGYSTNFHGVTGSADFSSDQAFIKPLQVHIEYCSCARGKQLQEVIEGKQVESQLLLLRKLYKAVQRKIWNSLGDSTNIENMLRGYWKKLWHTQNY